MPQQAGTYATPRLDLGRALQEFALDQQGFVGASILPPFDVSVKAGNFSALTRESLSRARDVTRAPKAAYNRDDVGLDEITFKCVEYGHEQLVDDSERAMYANDYDADDIAARVARDILLREQEKRIAAAIFNTTTWTGTPLYTDNSAAPWDAAATVIPTQIDAAIELIIANCGIRPNTMVIGFEQLKNLRVNTDLKDRFKYTSPLEHEAITGRLAALFGLEQVLVGSGTKNTGAEGATFTGGLIWADDYCWLGVCAKTGDLAEACVGRTLAWTGDGGQFTAEQYREEQTRTDVFRVRHYVQERIFDAYFGHLLKIDA